MKTDKYTQIRVSRTLHGVLKNEAETSGMSVGAYIGSMHERLQAIEAIMTTGCDVNIPRIKPITQQRSQKGKKPT